MKVLRRLTVCLLAIALALAAPIPRADAYFEQGDLNGDGRVSAADASCLLRALRNPRNMTDIMLERADVTQSGIVNKVDVRVMLAMATGKIPDLVSFVANISTGLNSESEFDRFCYTGTIRDGFNYRDSRISITITESEYRNAICYLADVYVQDVTSLRTAFSSGRSGGRLQYTDDIASAVDALIAVNGDYYSAQRKGPVVRNGVWYRNSISDQADVAVLSQNGEFQTFAAGTLTRAALAACNPYQTWVFGPRLLREDGSAFPSITGRLSGKNPRTALGYYAPGHYCLVVIDGRQKNYSSGLTLTDLSALMHALGCKSAYNLDGGQTSMMATADALINSPYKDGRPVSDIVYIAAP